MKVVKPSRLSLLHRSFDFYSENFLGVAAIGLIDLGLCPKILSEINVWKCVESELNSNGILDLGVPKSLPEFLISGYVYTNHQEEKTVCMAQARVAQLQKNIVVFGDRFWIDGKVTKPAPFEEMPVDWAHAYGGTKFAQNPLGRGAEDEIINGVRVHRLPNIESLNNRVQSLNQKVLPTGLGMVDVTWPQRFGKIGHYDDKWLKERFPGFADDIDWRMFNAAPEDQQWPTLDRFPPGAGYEIHNMHPQKPCLKGHLSRSAKSPDPPLCEVS